MFPARGVSAGPQLRCYVHVPFCGTRCGYCDFNTYVPTESGGRDRSSWRGAAVAEVELARRTLAGDDRAVASVFFGGGTPTLLPATDLGAVVAAVADQFGLAADAEVTVEANPEDVTPEKLDDLLAAGVNRLSIGMQSADERVLAALDRRHTPGRAVRAAELALAAGFAHVSLDLIYGTPGESLPSWRASVSAALATGVTHVSAYALKVEPGTAMGRRVARGEAPPVDDDVAADCYEAADELLTAAGLPWYEISNWAVPGDECQHNLGYWRGDDWWGIGPGAHSHLRGERWWNERHPRRWSEALAAGADPRAGSERLTAGQQLTERVMLELRLADGLDLATLPAPPGLHQVVAELLADGLARRSGSRLVLTGSGRRLADLVTIRLLEAAEPAA